MVTAFFSLFLLGSFKNAAAIVNANCSFSLSASTVPDVNSSFTVTVQGADGNYAVVFQRADGYTWDTKHIQVAGGTAPQTYNIQDINGFADSATSGWTLYINVTASNSLPCRNDNAIGSLPGNPLAYLGAPLIIGASDRTETCSLSNTTLNQNGTLKVTGNGFQTGFTHNVYIGQNLWKSLDHRDGTLWEAEGSLPETGANLPIPTGNYTVQVVSVNNPTPVVCGQLVVEPASPSSGKNPCSATSCSTAFGDIDTDITKFAGKFLSIAIGIAGGIALILLVFGSIRVLTSSGNQQTLAAGRDTIIAAIAGLLFLIFSVLILRALGIIVGITFP